MITMKKENNNNAAQKKRILFVTHSLGRGGMERVLVSIANALVNDSFDVTIICCFPNDDLASELDDRVKYFYKPRREFHVMPHIPHIRRYYDMRKWKWEHRSSAKKLYKYYVGNEKYDVEIGFWRGPSIKIISGSTNKKSKKIAWVHTDFRLCDPKSILLWFNNLEECKKAYASMDNVVCVSEEAANGFKEKMGIADNVSFIYNMIPTEEIIKKSNEPCQLKKRKFTIVTVGRLIPDKCHDRLLKAAKKLTDEGFDFDVWIVGGGQTETELKKLANDLSLNNIEFTGAQENPYTYMKNADLFVLTSRREGFAIVLPEAMACGLPVLSTACTGPVEILENGKYGMLVENSEDGVYEGIKRMMSEKDALEHYRVMSEKRFMRFDESVILKDIKELFN